MKQSKILVFFILLWSQAFCNNPKTLDQFSLQNFSTNIFMISRLNNLLSTVNTTVSKAGAWDPKNTLLAIFDGISGAATIFDQNNNNGVFIPGGMSFNTWNSTLEDWPSYMNRNNLSIRQLYHEGLENGTFFTLKNISKDIVDNVAKSLKQWGHAYAVQLQTSNVNPVDLLFNTTKSLGSIYNSTIKRNLPDAFPISDLSDFTNFLLDWSAFMKHLQNKLEQLKENQVNPASLLQTNVDGIESFALLLKKLENYLNLKELFDNFINYTNFMQLIAMFRSQDCNGVGGNIKKLYEQVSNFSYPLKKNASSLFKVSQSLENPLNVPIL